MSIAGIVYYDHVITFAEEYNHVWSKPWSGASVLFLLNRYVAAGAVRSQICGHDISHSTYSEYYCASFPFFVGVLSTSRYHIHIAGSALLTIHVVVCLNGSHCQLRKLTKPLYRCTHFATFSQIILIITQVIVARECYGDAVGYLELILIQK